MTNPWLLEFWRFVGVLFFALLVGLATGFVLPVLLLGVLGYVAWHLNNLRNLERWLSAKASSPPEVPGIWGAVFNHLYRMRKRDRKRKKRLTAMLARFRESTAAMPDATVVLNADGVIEWWNDAAGRLLGLRPNLDVGQSVTNLVRHPDFFTFFNEGDFREGVHISAPADSRVLLWIRVIPYGDNQLLMIARDVTRLHQLEQMRRDFIANVSHELRTPLTVITGYIESLSDSDDECARQWQRSLGAMEEQAARMQHIVTDLLLLTRLETERDRPQTQPVDVPKMLETLREDAVMVSRGAHVVDLDAQTGLWLEGAREELRSAFSNLIQNAVRYTPEGGRIRIRWFADDEGAHFQVQDTGIGIAPEHISRLTERFYRVDVGRSRETGGTGLGLAITKHVLMRHKGELRVQSTPGEGSTFSCDFPASQVVYQTEVEAHSESL